MSSMSISLSFQDISTVLAQSQQDPQFMPEENLSNQKSTQNSNQREDHKKDAEDEGTSISPSSLPGSPKSNNIPLSTMSQWQIQTSI